MSVCIMMGITETLYRRLRGDSAGILGWDGDSGLGRLNYRAGM